MSGILKTAAVAAFAAIVGLGATTSRASLSIIPMNSGSSYNGWKVFFPQGEGIALTQDDDGSAVHLVIEKFAQFNNNSSLLITFLQDKTAATVASHIDITNESITNSTGTNWTGFSYNLATPMSKMTGSAASFDAAHAFVPPTGGGVNYTGVSQTSDAVVYTGSQPDGTVSLWNQPATTNGDLLINVAPSTGATLQSFSFKETPLVSVPLPAAAWSGLTGLLGLAVVAYGKNIKKILA